MCAKERAQTSKWPRLLFPLPPSLSLSPSTSPPSLHSGLQSDLSARISGSCLGFPFFVFVVWKGEGGRIEHTVIPTTQHFCAAGAIVVLHSGSPLVDKSVWAAYHFSQTAPGGSGVFSQGGIGNSSGSFSGSSSRCKSRSFGFGGSGPARSIQVVL